jgi:hypothetical protein
MRLRILFGLVVLAAVALAQTAASQPVKCRLKSAGIFGNFTVTLLSASQGRVLWLAPIPPLDIQCGPPQGIWPVCRGQMANYIFELLGNDVVLRNAQTGGVIDTGRCAL